MVVVLLSGALAWMRARTEAYAIGAVRDDGRNPMAMAGELGLGGKHGLQPGKHWLSSRVSAILELEV
jgi:hypothetical protein